MPPGISRPFAAAALFLAALAPAEAAILTSNGVVMVNRGNGFELVQGATEVNPGDTVLVNEGSAQMVYPDGTTAALEPGQLHTVLEAPPSPPPAVEAVAPATTGGLTTTTLVVGGVAAVGGIGLAVSAAKGGSDSKTKKPSSP